MAQIQLSSTGEHVASWAEQQKLQPPTTSRGELKSFVASVWDLQSPGQPSEREITSTASLSAEPVCSAGVPNWAVHTLHRTPAPVLAQHMRVCVNGCTCTPFEVDTGPLENRVQRLHELLWGTECTLSADRSAIRYTD